MVTDSPMMERWFFYQDSAGLWKWARLDVMGTVLAHSGCSFESRDAAVEQARVNGYEEGRLPEHGIAEPRHWVARPGSLSSDRSL